jgi:uncharacterized protein (UPF0332 family)
LIVLDPEQIDLADLALALQDHSGEHVWCLDTVTGELTPRFGAALEIRAELQADDRLLPVEPLPTAVDYGDMEEFVRRVRDARIREVLERSIGGHGAFRRFKDALLDYPRLRRSWFAFHDARGERRAIEWLAEHGLCDAADAEQALLRRPEPAPADLPGLLDAEAVAHRVGRDLQRLYRERLTRVSMVGAWARGDAHPEAELELLVELDAIDDRWEEKVRMDRILWRHSIRNDTVVTAVPAVDAADANAEAAGARALRRATQEITVTTVLVAGGYASQAISRAYMAGFHAASAALLSLGELPATRSGVVSAFGRRLVADHGFDHEIGRILRRLFDLHADVDYGLVDAPIHTATVALADAERFVEAVRRWVGEKALEPSAGMTG